MPEHKRTDRQALITNSDSPKNLEEQTLRAKLNALPDTTSGLSVLPDGSWFPVHRPLATFAGATPFRGAEGHGTDNRPDVAFQPDQSGAVPPIRDDGGVREWSEIEFDPITSDDDPRSAPLFVSVVPDPTVSVIKSTQYKLLYSSTMSLVVPWANVGVPSTENILTFPADPRRKRISFISSARISGAPNVRALLAISRWVSFDDYVVFGGSHLDIMAPPLVIDSCSDAFYVTLLPGSAYNPGGFNGNAFSMAIEYEYPVGNNPANVRA